MTREELRDYVEEQRNLDVIPYHVYSTLIDGIDTLDQEPKTEWIPVSERLPEDDTEVIYCDKNGVRGNCHYWKGFNRYPRDKGEYEFSNDIVAWLPLPEPYKAEKGGE